MPTEIKAALFKNSLEYTTGYEAGFNAAKRQILEFVSDVEPFVSFTGTTTS